MPQMMVLDAAEQVPTPLVGHPVHGVTDGFPIGTRLVRLGVSAFADLSAQVGAPRRDDRMFWSGCRVVLVLPHLRHVRFQSEDMDCTDAALNGVIAPLLRALGLPVAPDEVQIIEAGHAGTAAALAWASERMGREGVKACLVLAIDSLLDDLSLEWLASSGRLKGDGIPCGLVPGEAGVCFLIEDRAQAVARGATIAAEVIGSGYGEDTSGEQSPVTRGRKIAEVFAAALPPTTGAPECFSGTLFTDHNGEVFRSHVLAVARQVLEPGGLLVDGPPVMPATGFGETGAASGAVGLCAAVHHLWREPGRAGRAAVISFSDRGGCGVIILGRAG